MSQPNDFKHFTGKKSSFKTQKRKKKASIFRSPAMVRSAFFRQFGEESVGIICQAIYRSPRCPASHRSASMCVPSGTSQAACVPP